MKGNITMSNKEVGRIQILEMLKTGLISIAQGGVSMGVSYRQARRIYARYKDEGVTGVLHRNRDKEPSNKLSSALREQILFLYNERYKGCNDTHFKELIAEREGIVISRESIRRILRLAGISPKRSHAARKHRRRRARKSLVGEMVLWDGSIHRWFGADLPAVCLLAAVDDASGSLLGAIFVEAEGSVGYMKLLEQVLRRHGVPLSIYHDGHTSLVRSDNEWSWEERVAGRQYPTHVGRVLESLGIRSIRAHSPQAKGRIERLFGTLQDRMIVESSLAGIKDIESGNKWLEEVFIKRYNERFAFEGVFENSAFRAITASEIREKVCFAYEGATVGNDNCVRLGGLQIDIPRGVDGRSYAKAKVLVKQYLDGSWSVIYGDNKLIAKHPATPLRAPIRQWKKRSAMPKGSGRREVKSYIQVYEITEPDSQEKGHFPSAVMRTF